MDTISRENNSMLPVGGIIVGVIALIVGSFAAIKVSSLQKQVAEHETKLQTVDQVKATADSASAASDKNTKDLAAFVRSTQDAFNQIGPELGRLRGDITTLQEAAKKPAPVEVAGKKGSAKAGPVTAGPDEYVVKPGDTGSKIAKAVGCTSAQLTEVNPGVNFSKLKPGQKIKIPAKK